MEDEGLGALDTIKGSGGNVPIRYVLTVTQNLRMFFRQAKGTVTADLRDAFMWERVQEIATKGPFNRVFIDAPGKDTTPSRSCLATSTSPLRTVLWSST